LIFFFGPYLSVDNLDKPFIPYGRDFYTSTSNRMIKYSNLYFRSIEIQSDIGWLFQEQTNLKNYVITAEITETLSYRVPTDTKTYFQEFVLRCEKSRKGIYKRTYKKIQNLVAEIGGLMKVLMMAGALICIPIANLDMKKKLVNEVFCFDGN
jgi:hypothetical protein